MYVYMYVYVYVCKYIVMHMYVCTLCMYSMYAMVGRYIGREDVYWVQGGSVHGVSLTWV